MFGYATNETEECMPLTIILAHKLNAKLAELRRNGVLPWLRPDSKTQVRCLTAAIFLNGACVKWLIETPYFQAKDHATGFLDPTFLGWVSCKHCRTPLLNGSVNMLNKILTSGYLWKCQSCWILCKGVHTLSAFYFIFSFCSARFFPQDFLCLNEKSPQMCKPYSSVAGCKVLVSTCKLKKCYRFFI